MKKRIFGKMMITISAFLLGGLSLSAQLPPPSPVDPVDLCMRLAGGSTTDVEIVMRPTTNILAADILSEIRYTISWQEPGVVITPGFGIAPFNLLPQGVPVLNGGFYYQTFITQPGIPFGININAGQEVVIATFSCSTPLQADLYLTNDQYTLDNNIQYYYEIWGLDRTGTIYCSSVQISPDLTVPLSGWAVLVPILLITGTIIFTLRRI